jgi:hypothetical protein|tara:strand:- start:744 stop:866 length:123 start_codon:yes stop_codon:yes gene_type:complete
MVTMGQKAAGNILVKPIMLKKAATQEMLRPDKRTSIGNNI